MSQKQWAVAIGDNDSGRYQQLVETPEGIDQLVTLFDGSAYLVTGDFRDLVREQLRPTSEPEKPIYQRAQSEPTRELRDAPSEPTQGEMSIPAPAKRFVRVRLSVQDLALAKTNNLQPYLFRFLQEQDAAAEVNVTIDVSSKAGIPQDILEQRIVEGLDQLGIEVKWNGEEV